MPIRRRLHHFNNGLPKENNVLEIRHSVKRLATALFVNSMVTVPPSKPALEYNRSAYNDLLRFIDGRPIPERYSGKKALLHLDNELDYLKRSIVNVGMMSFRRDPLLRNAFAISRQALNRRTHFRLLLLICLCSMSSPIKSFVNDLNGDERQTIAPLSVLDCNARLLGVSRSMLEECLMYLASDESTIVSFQDPSFNPMFMRPKDNTSANPLFEPDDINFDESCYILPCYLTVLGSQRVQDIHHLMSCCFEKIPTANQYTLSEQTQPVFDYMKLAVEQNIRGVNILLYGQPGVGKTTLAEYIAHSLGVPLFDVSTIRTGPDDDRPQRVDASNNAQC